jgi:hypothetical protein
MAQAACAMKAKLNTKLSHMKNRDTIVARYPMRARSLCRGSMVELWRECDDFA